MPELKSGEFPVVGSSAVQIRIHARRIDLAREPAHGTTLGTVRPIAATGSPWRSCTKSVRRESRAQRAARIMSEAFSPIMMQLAFRFALTTKGMMEASTT